MHLNKHFKTLRPFVTVLFIKGLLDVGIGIGIGIGLLKIHIAASKAELHEITV